MTMICVYRKATDHLSTDGLIVQKKLGGEHWDLNPTTIYNDATYDCRDPSITKLANGNLVVPFFRWDGGAVDVQFVKSIDDAISWSGITEIANSFTDWAAIGAPIVELSNGDWVAALYGRNTGDARESAISVKSDDDGVTWGSEATIGDGETDTIKYQEPNIALLANGNLLAVIRTDANVIHTSTSTDDAASWSSPSPAFDGSGSPHTIQLASGDLLCCYRSKTVPNTDLAVMRTSDDNGATWSSEALIDDAGDYDFMAYASPWQLADGTIGIAYGVELTDGSQPCEIRYTTFTENELP